jgi:hypothetical protein
MTNDPIGDALRRKADEVGDHDHPLDLDDVKGRARGIRRRRLAVSGLAAAAVLAVATPFGAALDHRVTGVPAPAASGPTTPDAGDPAPRDGVLTNQVDAEGRPPGIPYLLDGTIHTTDGEKIPVEGDYAELVALGDGWVASDYAAGTVDVLDASGGITRTDEATGPLAVSRDGTVAAYATPRGELMTVAVDSPAGDPRLLRLEAGGTAPERVQPVAVQGSGSCEAADGDGCAVFFNGEQDLVPQAFSSTSGGVTEAIGNLRELGGVSIEGPVTGTTSVTDDGSCSAMWDRAGDEAWTTCDHTLGRFSPDGRYVVGHPAYLDGLGDPSVAILDVASGEVVAQWQSTANSQALINSAAWDTDGTLLATVWEEDTWSLMRMSPDGSLRTVLADLGGDIEDVPLHLATRP